MAHTTHSSRKSSLVKIAGALGIASTLIALATFLMGLFGFYAAFMLSPLALILGTLAIILTIVGVVMKMPDGDEETQPIAALFVGMMGVVGGLIQLQLWMHWPQG